MKFIDDYSDFLPQEDIVSDYKDLVDKKYQIIDDESSGYKVVLIDDRLYYLTGPFGFKSKLANRIYFDMSSEKEYHEPSLRKAIKEWIVTNS